KLGEGQVRHEERLCFAHSRRSRFSVRACGLAQRVLLQRHARRLRQREWGGLGRRLGKHRHGKTNDNDGQLQNWQRMTKAKMNAHRFRTCLSKELARSLSPALFARAETVIWITELEWKLFHGEISSDLGFGWLQVLHPIRRVRDDFIGGMKARCSLHHRSH